MTPFKFTIGFTTFALMAGLSLGSSSFAAGGGSTTTQDPGCKKGLVWDRVKEKCVKAKKSSGLSDDNIYGAARQLAYTGRYEEAITVLNLATNRDDPRILNYLGYSNRKLGRVETGLTYYRKALKADPDYTLVMSYMGEAFLQLGRVDDARKQLNDIKARCGTQCREFVILKRGIDQATQ